MFEVPSQVLVLKGKFVRAGEVGAIMSPSSSEMRRTLMGTHCGMSPKETLTMSVNSLPASVAPEMANDDCPSDQVTGYGDEKFDEKFPGVVEALELAAVLSMASGEDDAVEEGNANVATEELALLAL